MHTDRLSWNDGGNEKELPEELYLHFSFLFKIALRVLLIKTVNREFYSVPLADPGDPPAPP